MPFKGSDEGAFRAPDELLQAQSIANLLDTAVKIPFIGILNQPNLLEHSYQTEDGDHLIFIILFKKGQS